MKCTERVPDLVQKYGSLFVAESFSIECDHSESVEPAGCNGSARRRVMNRSIAPQFDVFNAVLQGRFCPLPGEPWTTTRKASFPSFHRRGCNW